MPDFENMPPYEVFEKAKIGSPINVITYRNAIQALLTSAPQLLQDPQFMREIEDINNRITRITTEKIRLQIFERVQTLKEKIKADFGIEGIDSFSVDDIVSAAITTYTRGVYVTVPERYRQFNAIGNSFFRLIKAIDANEVYIPELAAITGDAIFLEFLKNTSPIWLAPPQTDVIFTNNRLVFLNFGKPIQSLDPYPLEPGKNIVIPGCGLGAAFSLNNLRMLPSGSSLILNDNSPFVVQSLQRLNSHYPERAGKCEIRPESMAEMMLPKKSIDLLLLSNIHATGKQNISELVRHSQSFLSERGMIYGFNVDYETPDGLTTTDIFKIFKSHNFMGDSRSCNWESAGTPNRLPFEVFTKDANTFFAALAELNKKAEEPDKKSASYFAYMPQNSYQKLLRRGSL